MVVHPNRYKDLTGLVYRICTPTTDQSGLPSVPYMYTYQSGLPCVKCKLDPASFIKQF